MGKKDLEIKFPKGKSIEQFKSSVRKHKLAIERGKIIAIDPASKKSGWAIYDKMKFISSGVIDIDGKLPINKRLQELHNKIQELGDGHILGIENIKGARAHDYLKYAVGVALAGCKTPEFIIVPIILWKAVAATQEDYIKTDENDAKMIGLSIIKMYEEIYNADLYMDRQEV